MPMLLLKMNAYERFKLSNEIEKLTTIFPNVCISLRIVLTLLNGRYNCTRVQFCPSLNFRGVQLLPKFRIKIWVKIVSATRLYTISH